MDESSADAEFEEVVSGGRMSQERMMMEKMHADHERIRREEKSTFDVRQRVHQKHMHDALHLEASNGNLKTRKRAAVPHSTLFSRVSNLAVDVVCLVAVVVLPWRMALALREQAAKGKRPPLFARR